MRTLTIILSFGFFSCGHEPKTTSPALTEIPPVHDTAIDKLIGPNPVDDPSFAETEDITSTHGPGNITRNVLQDRNGNIWFATWEGIISYDASTSLSIGSNLFTNFTLKENLKHFHVFSVLEDRAGNLWFGTIGGGVYRYDGRYFTLFTTTDGLASNVVLCLLEDRAGNIWFGTDNGVSRYDPSTALRTGSRTFTNFTKEEVRSGNSVNSIAQDKTGKLWFGTRGGVSCYDGKSFTSFTNKKEERSFHNVRSILEDKNGNIWIGSEEGLCYYNPTSDELTNFTTNFIGYIFEDKTGNLWLSEGEDGGMALYRYDRRSFTKIKSGDKQVFGITEDREGNIWFGTEKGVCRYDGKSFTDFTESVSNQ